ncbi:hypothetical protein K5M56_12525, partial [Serratia marcescens]|nr:hypothetical protein [Serratia marcescens]
FIGIAGGLDDAGQSGCLVCHVFVPFSEVGHNKKSLEQSALTALGFRTPQICYPVSGMLAAHC